jgi:hypothetical protein
MFRCYMGRAYNSAILIIIGWVSNPACLFGINIRGRIHNILFYL